MKKIKSVAFPTGMILAAMLWIATGYARADDDWEAVPSSPSSAPQTSAPQPEAAYPMPRSHRRGARAAQPAPAGDANVINACGEKAVAPSSKVQGIVSQINATWGSDVRVYQSVAPEGPHAILGGCIFYNPQALAVLLGMRLNLNDPTVYTPMLYAIFAHEAGHQYHRDFDPSRASVPNQVKELEADRFAGYTLEKLKVPATGLAPYWGMTGDEFGLGASHGSSQQRLAAFRQGWHEAEWNRSENSTSVTAATEQSVAPEDSSSAP